MAFSCYLNLLRGSTSLTYFTKPSFILASEPISPEFPLLVSKPAPILGPLLASIPVSPAGFLLGLELALVLLPALGLGLALSGSLTTPTVGP